MASRRRLTPLVCALTTAAVVAATAAVALAEAPPVGPLPPGPVATLVTQRGELVAVALPHRLAGRVWRIARPVDARVLVQVSEADVGTSVVVIFRATGTGAVTVAFGLTRGERTKAYESRRYKVQVR